MTYRIEVACRPDVRDVSGNNVKNRITQFLALPVESVSALNVYLVDLPVSKPEASAIMQDILHDPVIQNAKLNRIDLGNEFDWIVEIGYKPGVTDTVGATAKEAVSDFLKRDFDLEKKIYSSFQYRIKAPRLNLEQVKSIGFNLLGNNLIQTIQVHAFDKWASAAPSIKPPLVGSAKEVSVHEFNLDMTDDELMALSKERTLSLELDEMKIIQNYVKSPENKNKRTSAGAPEKLTDVELEVLAQTWSEHCKHKIFNSKITYNENESTEVIDSVFKTYIVGSTKVIDKRVPWLLSVFKDNAGVIEFNKDISIVYKVETHNSPSALEPYGGAITGIVGCNRDPMGTGIGAELLYNVWGYCFGDPHYDGDISSGLLHPNRIREGVHHGVIDGGNQCGIPYARGWEFFDDRFMGKPLVFCGTVGWFPAKINGKPAHDKMAYPGDLIVMAGGRIGKDGIHGATFSSAELTEDSPVQAVQIGDPITQKKMNDFILEARDKGLYNCITDNGAGGLSSSVGEMAEFSNGCEMDLAKAPLKYAGLEPWEILISEAQERMTLAVAHEQKEELFKLAEKRGVELTVLGKFTDTGIFDIKYGDKTVAYLDMDFLHEGNPQLELNAVWKQPNFEEPFVPRYIDHNNVIKAMMARLNICSNEGKSRQYDHEVKGLSVIKPFCGINADIPSDATVLLIDHFSKEGVVLSEGKNPHYSDIDTYHMTASVIDESVRKMVATGGSLDKMAGLDNFCWPDPVQSDKTPDGEYKLAQLVRANKAIYDYTTAFNIPCISGKDSMKNDTVFNGEKISIPPTLLYSAISKIDDVSKAVTLDIKKSGDLIYVVGVTFDELGASEFYHYLCDLNKNKGVIGNNVPKVDAKKALKTYRAVSSVVNDEIANSIHTPTIGGLAIGFVKMALGGNLGLDVDLSKVLQSDCNTNAEILYSESNSRFIITISPDKKIEFEKVMTGIPYAEIGKTINEPTLNITGFEGNSIIDTPLTELSTSWKSTLKDFFNGNA